MYLQTTVTPTKGSFCLEFRMYSRKELGSIYFPWFKEPRASSRALTRTIYSDGELLTRLEEVGFRKGLRYLSPQMVMILAQYLGDPTLFHEIHKA